jgi:hypothetical protein
MVATNVDHITAIIVFLGAMLIFIGLFSQTVETAISYQEHTSLATKASDLIDNLLLNPGDPSNWGTTETSITSFGLQDPEFIQYQVSPFSAMRLHPSTESIVYFQGQSYCNETTSVGGALYVPSDGTIDYSQATKMMGVNGVYGFSLSLYPTINVTVYETSQNPLTISIKAEGQGLPLSNADLSYCLITSTGVNPPSYPSLDIDYGSTTTDLTGTAILDLSYASLKPYFIIVHVSLSGLSGVGYLGNSNSLASVIPIITGFEARSVALVHSYSVTSEGYDGNLTYNAVFLRAKDMIQTTLNNGESEVKGMLYCNATPSHEADSINIDPDITGILIVAYSKTTAETGIVAVPWGLSSLGFSAILGGHSNNHNWVSTDIRQVLVNEVPYQAKLAVWSSTTEGVN